MGSLPPQGSNPCGASRLEVFALGRLGVASKTEAEVADLVCAALHAFAMPTTVLPVRVDHRTCACEADREEICRLYAKVAAVYGDVLSPEAPRENVSAVSPEATGVEASLGVPEHASLEAAEVGCEECSR